MTASTLTTDTRRAHLLRWAERATKASRIERCFIAGNARAFAVNPNDDAFTALVDATAELHSFDKTPSRYIAALGRDPEEAREVRRELEEQQEQALVCLLGGAE